MDETESRVRSAYAGRRSAAHAVSDDKQNNTASVRFERKSMITHPFPPLFDGDSRVLILGSFPSVASREQNFFYGHPRNRFWQVTAIVFGAPVPGTIEEKRAFLHAHYIALWDVVASCEITGSSDASIRNVIPNDLSPILRGAPIGRIFTNGGTAYSLYRKYISLSDRSEKKEKRMPAVPANEKGGFVGTISGERENRHVLEPVKLPSTSPANAAWTLERLVEAWRVIAE